MTRDVRSLVEASPPSPLQGGLGSTTMVHFIYASMIRCCEQSQPISLGKKCSSPRVRRISTYLRRNFEETATSLRRNFDKSTMKLRRHMDVTFRRICDITVTKLRRRFVVCPLGLALL